MRRAKLSVPPQAWDAAEEERSAIAEYGAARAWVEGFVRLHPDRPVGDVPAKRWLQFTEDVGKFLDGGWAEKAAALGWGPYDLFGCDRDKPFARVDRAGLLWLLNGRALAALSAGAAVIETRTGSKLTYRRKPDLGGTVLAWEWVPTVEATQ